MNFTYSEHVFLISFPPFPSPDSDNGGHSVGNGHGELGLGPQGGASEPWGRVPELRPHPEGPGPALHDHSPLSGPRCRSEGKGREGSFREAGLFTPKQ